MQTRKGKGRGAALIDAVTLRSHGFSLGLAPARGGAALFLAIGDDNILRPARETAVAADPRNAACFPCVPWFGRLYGALTFEGRSWPMRPTLPVCAPENALHGDGWVSPWEIVTHTEDRLLCRFSGKGDTVSGFPFFYEATQNFGLSRAGLTIDLSLTNIGARSMPSGLGLHPFFVRSPATRIAFKAEKRWTPPGDGPGRLGPLANKLGTGVPAQLPAKTLDHSFTSFGGEAIVHGEGAPIRFASDAPILHVYAPAREDYFCLEPVTHLPGELTESASGFGGRVLSPREEMRLTMAIGPA